MYLDDVPFDLHVKHVAYTVEREIEHSLPGTTFAAVRRLKQLLVVLLHLLREWRLPLEQMHV